MLAKMASEQAKPDGLVLIRPGTERELLAPMPVRALPGVGPATAEHLRRAGIGTLAEMVEAGEAELVRLLTEPAAAQAQRDGFVGVFGMLRPPGGVPSEAAAQAVLRAIDAARP